MDTIPISEIFYSLQGEGKNIGKPFIFIRFALCNLHCTFCDTKYTWEKDALEYNNYSISSLISKLRNLSQKHSCTNFLFTGGEPLLHQDIIIQIIKEFPSFFTEIETNGSIPLEFNADQVNISYKLSNANVKSYELKILPKKNHHYKFVISEEEDIQEALEICASHNIPKSNTFFMPEGTEKEILIERSYWLVEKCKANGVNFSPRMHILLWGNTRNT